MAAISGYYGANFQLKGKYGKKIKAKIIIYKPIYMYIKWDQFIRKIIK